MGRCLPAARVSAAHIERFISTRLALTPLEFYPGISLFRATPRSGLTAFLAENGFEDETPYWAYAWAGGAALALYLRDHPERVRGRNVLDLGAGSGLVGISASKAGAAKVWASEADPLGQVALMLNAGANGAALELWTEAALPQADIVLAGDVFYDAGVAAHMLPLLQGLAVKGIQVLVGDPFRRDLPLAHLEQIAAYAVPDMGGGPKVEAGIFAVKPALAD